MMSTPTQSAEYKDAVVDYYAKNYKDAVDYLDYCESNGVTVKFVDWTKNIVTTVERGVYGETYG